MKQIHCLYCMLFPLLCFDLSKHIHFTVDGHLDCFFIFFFSNNAAVKILTNLEHVHSCFCWYLCRGGSLIAFPVFISHLGIIFDEGPILYFPHFFFYLHCLHFFNWFWKIIYSLWVFLLVTDIVNISLEGLSFHSLLLRNMEKELSKCSYVKRLCVIKKSLVPQFNLYNLIYILPK